MSKVIRVTIDNDFIDRPTVADRSPDDVHDFLLLHAHDVVRADEDDVVSGL